MKKNNLERKERLEEEGVKVLVGLPNKKYTQTLCHQKRVNNKTIQYGFVSTETSTKKNS